MVLLNNNSPVKVNSELKMESGRYIRYVAPPSANHRQETCSNYEDAFRVRRYSNPERAVDEEEWEGVNSLCQTLDCIVEMYKETDLFEGKRVLEIGFASGLPSVFAWENGASEINIHNTCASQKEFYSKPTVQRNRVPMNKCKFSSGDLTDLKKAIGGKKFDVILAADILNRSVSDYKLLHDIIGEALDDAGICLFSCQSHYFTCDGSLDAFLSLVRSNRTLDAVQRWSSPRTDIIQTKVYQLTRSIY